MRSNASESEPQSNPKDSSSSKDGPLSASQVLEHTLYDELRKLATAKLAQEKPGQTLQATALVHDAYIRLVDVEIAQHWDSCGHFFAAAAEAMRRILVENARRKQRLKHGGGHERLNLDEVEAVTDAPTDDLLALDDALAKLERHEPAKADVVKLRCFAGMSVEEAAEALGISRATAKRRWAYARAWLFAELNDPDDSSHG
jgi:RNA polymerase sigma factor (TIGR02999 family)